MGALDRVLLAADLLEPDALGGAHEHLLKTCPWYAHVSEGGGDGPEKHCKAAKGEVKASAVLLTPRTAEASTVVKPTVPPGGPGLFHIKGRNLPPYMEHLFSHLKAKYGKAAYKVANGIVHKWAAGINPGGRHPAKTHPDVRAAAQRNIAEWEKDKSDAHAQSRQRDSKRVKATVELAQPAATAPGAAPVGPAPGLYERPSQTVSPSPPLPPGAKLPTAAEIRKLIGQIPQCSDASLSASARNHLDAAAMKLSKDDPLAALHVLRAAQSDIYAAHKADLGALGPAANTANVFARTVPPGERSSANTAMLRGRDQESRWRTLELAVATAIDQIRRRHFHGMYGGSPLARFSQEDGMSALGKVLRLAGGVPPISSA